MKNITLIGFGVLVIGIGVFWYSQMSSTVGVEDTMTSVQTTDNTSLQEIPTSSTKIEDEKKVSEASNPAVAQSNSIKVTKLSGITFSLFSDWQEVTKPETYTLMGVGFRGLSYKTTDVAIRELSNEQMMNNESDLISGLTFGVAFSPENLATNLENSVAYVDFEYKNSKDCSNCSHIERIVVDNIPAILIASRAENNGGQVNVHLYKDGEIFTASMSYPDSYDQVETLFRQILTTVNFTE